jgi:hypothetical protein
MRIVRVIDEVMRRLSAWVRPNGLLEQRVKALWARLGERKRNRSENEDLSR